MRLLIDMPLSVETAAWLRSKGHDVVHLREQGLQRLPDEAIVEKARAEHRIILTMDLGFGHLLAFARRADPSVVLLRVHDARPLHIHKLLTDALPQLEATLQQGAIAVIEEHETRIHRLPIQEAPNQ